MSDEVAQLLENEIAERKLVEAKLRREKQLSDEIISSLPGVFYIVNEAGFFVQCNQSWLDVTGYSNDEVLRMHALDFVCEKDKAVVTDKMQQVFAEGESWVELDLLTKSGKQIPYHCTGRRSLLDGIPYLIGVGIDITERKQADDLIWRQANFDPLTQLPNRRLFHNRLAQEIKKAARTKRSLALLFIDLDRFKEVNDALGHSMGDELLIKAAQRIVACVRETDTVACLGGDEFTIILAELADASRAECIAQAVIETLSKPFQLGGELAYLSASVGITIFPDDGEDADELIKNADQAMSDAKHAGRNRLSYFTYAMQEATLLRQQLIKDLRAAFTDEINQLSLYFQPIVELSTGRIVKAEALLRWRHPEKGMIYPTDFIYLTEEIGMIKAIGDWVFKESVRWAKRWVDMGNESFQISLNKSPAQFMTSTNHDAWLSFLEKADLSGKHIVIEITEGLLLNADTFISKQLLQLRNAGIQIAIDDFGTGYSSLSYLKKFDIDYLKIDRSFICNLSTDSDDMALCEAIIVMAHKLGLQVVAEGVETVAQKDVLVAAGCDYGQGYLFAEALSAEAFEHLLEASRLS